MSTLRGTDSFTGGGSGCTLNFPVGSVAGDTAYVFVANFVGGDAPLDWTIVGGVWPAGNFNMTAFRKELTSGDITTGSVTFAFPGSGGIFAAIAVYVGIVGSRLPGEFDAISGSPAPFLSDTSVLTGDSCLIFAAKRDWDDIRCSIGTQLQVGASASASSGCLYEYVPGSDGQFGGNITRLWGNAAEGVIVVDIRDGAPPIAGSAVIPQLASVLVAEGEGGSAQVQQYAYVIVADETPPAAGGAVITQFAMVLVVNNFGNPSQAMMGSF